MRYKLILFAVFLIGFISNPVFSQEISPIIVTTLKSATPTTVITGQQFTQTYLVRFIDLADWGKRIEIREEELSKAWASDDFEVLKLEKEKVVPPVKQFTEHWWYLTYTLRIISSEKGPKVIPPLPIPWVLIEDGQDPSDPNLKVNSDLKTDPVHINYATTIPQKETSLDIRDSLYFGSFGQKAFWFRAASWFLGIVPLSLFVLTLVTRRKSAQLVKDVKTSDLSDKEEEVVSNIEVLSRDKALRRLKKELQGFHKLNPNTFEEADLFRLEKGLSKSLSAFLRAELSLGLGTTPLEIFAHVEQKLKDSRYKNSMLEMARINAVYDDDVQRGKMKSCDDFILQTQKLRSELNNTSWYSKIFGILRRRK